MKGFHFSRIPDFKRFENRLENLREEFNLKEPTSMASATSSIWHPTVGTSGQFLLSLWYESVVVDFPSGEVHKASTGRLASPMEQTLLLYYFTSADGEPMANEWISFSDLPDGRFYNQAFQGYSGAEIARAFGLQIQAFREAAGNLGGVPENLGDASFRFYALPNIPILVVYWLGDEEFASSAQVLFDRSASHYLPTDACAILGSAITRKLLTA